MRIEFVRKRFGAHAPDEPEVPEDAHAAVAVVFREGATSVEVLLIERAEREGDPWSGHMAFPGGHLEPQDASTIEAARRETLEEVGVELTNAEYLGRLDAIAGHPRSKPKMVVAAHAFYLEEHQSFELALDEVQSAFWFPLADMLEETRSVKFSIPERPDMRFPGILVGVPDRHVVWGLTYRFLENLMVVLGHRIPDSSDDS